MRILIYSPLFLPSVGGLEVVVATCAEGFAARGHEVAVVTTTPGLEPDASPYRVVRRPGPIELLKWTIWCDVYFQANVSLRGLWPLALVRRPWVVSHHSWYCRPDGRIGMRDRLKRWLIGHARASIAVSNAMAADLETPCTVIGNPYRDRLFGRLPGVARTGTLIFVGRLVSDKGVDVLLDALHQLKARGLAPRLSIVGEGPERPALETLTRRLGLAEQVEMRGVLQGEALVAELNRHRLLIVPSRYNEPFGVVALEAIACGCAVIGSSGGGLPEAIGSCGKTFPNGNARELAQVIEDLMSRAGAIELLLTDADRHLRRHAGDSVIERYLAVIGDAIGNHGR